MSVDLTTTYLGLKLKNPLVIGACPLTEKVETLQRLEAAGAAAAVLPSLFEEQIDHDQIEMARVQDFHTESFAESLTYFPEQDDYHAGPEGYLDYIAKAKQAVKIPIIASLNGTSVGGWTRYAKMMQDAGADALELNIYFVAADVETTADEVEARYLELVAAVKQSVSIPLAVKVGPYFSAMANMARRLADAGADGLVLFNRFLQPDIDLETMETTPRLVLSTPFELLLPLRWIAILHGRVNASLALTGGLHDPAACSRPCWPAPTSAWSPRCSTKRAPSRSAASSAACASGWKRRSTTPSSSSRGAWARRTAPTRPPSSAATT